MSSFFDTPIISCVRVAEACSEVVLIFPLPSSVRNFLLPHFIAHPGAGKDFFGYFPDGNLDYVRRATLALVSFGGQTDPTIRVSASHGYPGSLRSR